MEPKVKITDFGCATQLDKNGTYTGKKNRNMAGTFAFMAPEVIDSDTMDYK